MEYEDKEPSFTGRMARGEKDEGKEGAHEGRKSKFGRKGRRHKKRSSTRK